MKRNGSDLCVYPSIAVSAGEAIRCLVVVHQRFVDEYFVRRRSSVSRGESAEIRVRFRFPGVASGN